MITEQQFRDYFPDIIDREGFSTRIEEIYRSKMVPFLDGYANPPRESAVKKDAKKLLAALRKMECSGNFSDLFICEEAGLPEHTLKKIVSACERLAEKDCRKHKDYSRLNTIFSLDVLYREFTDKNPELKNDRADFVRFVSGCFSVYRKDYPSETAESAIKDYLKTDLPEKAACAAEMIEYLKRKNG